MSAVFRLWWLWLAVILVTLVVSIPPAQAQDTVASKCNIVACFGINWANPSLHDVMQLDAQLVDSNGFTPLHYAALNCVSSAHLYELVENGADINAIEHVTRRTPLQYAVIVCNSNTSGVLLDLGADPNVIDPSTGGNVLHLALKRNKSFNLFKRLMRSNVFLDQLDSNGLAPLVVALAKENIGVVDFLLDAGANPNVADADGVTLAHYAAYKLDHEKLERLRRLGANLDAVDKRGMRPMHMAAQSGINAQIAAVFIDADVAVNTYDNNGMTPLHMASALTAAPAVAALLVMQADPHQSDDAGNTPLHYALRNNNDPKVVTALLRLGADPNLPDGEGNLPIELASTYQSSDAPLLDLIAYGADVQHVDASGRTLLHHAVLANNAMLAATLLKHSADPYAQDDLGKTPMVLALANAIGEPAKSMFMQLDNERRTELQQAQEIAKRHRVQADARAAKRYAKRKELVAARTAQRGKKIHNVDQAESQLRKLAYKKKTLERQNRVIKSEKKTEQNNKFLKEIEVQKKSVRERLQAIKDAAAARRNRSRKGKSKDLAATATAASDNAALAADAQ